MAFQLIDDVLDLIGDPSVGKPVGTDMRSGVLTMPVLLELAQPSGGDLREHSCTVGTLLDLAQASRLIVNSGRIDDVIEAARQYAKEAAAAIAEVPRATRLSRFPSSYVDWALEEFVAA